jgi:hypothetical protein
MLTANGLATTTTAASTPSRPERSLDDVRLERLAHEHEPGADDDPLDVVGEERPGEDRHGQHHQRGDPPRRPVPRPASPERPQGHDHRGCHQPPEHQTSALGTEHGSVVRPGMYDRPAAHEVVRGPRPRGRCRRSWLRTPCRTTGRGRSGRDRDAPAGERGTGRAAARARSRRDVRSARAARPSSGPSRAGSPPWCRRRPRACRSTVTRQPRRRATNGGATCPTGRRGSRGPRRAGSPERWRAAW